MKNTNYKKDRPSLSEDQILKNKDFNHTLKQVRPNGKGYLKSFKYWGIAGVASIAIIASIFLLNNKPNIQQTSAETDFTYQPSDKLSQLTSILPPFKKYNIEYEVFEIDCSKDEEITSKSGTIFNIPKNSLTDDNKNIVSGIAKIKYRELRNPVDFFLSGIPMDYDSAGTTYTFESAGMLDIKASQNNTPLYLAENKTVDFKFNSTSTDNGFNFYSLNEQSGVWSLEKQNINTEQFTEVKEKAAHSPTEQTIPIVKPEKQNKKKYSLNLAVDKSNYPELEKYEGTIFEINESEQAFDPVIYKIQWENASLSDSKIKGNYSLQLTREDSSISITVYPVVKDKFYEQAQYKYKIALANYKNKLQNNSDDFEAYNNYNGISLKDEIISNTVREFSIAGFGIYNCDTPRMQPQLMANKTIVNNDETRPQFSQYYVANPIKNSVVNLSSNTNNRKVKYYKKGASVVWFVNDDGGISILHPEQFENINDYRQLTAEIFSPNQGIDILRDLMEYK